MPALIARLMVVFLVLGVALSAGAQVIPADLKDVAVPTGAYWATQEVVVGRGQSVTHRHGLEFVFALKGDSVVRIGSAAVTIPEGKAFGVPAGVAHTHLAAGQGESRIVASQLAGEVATWGTLEIVRTRRTTSLAGFRQGPQLARLSEVVLAPFAQTPVHSHPGPEAVYILEGPIVLQTEGKLVMLLRGDLAVLPGDTALQARYIGGTGQGRFLALFVVAEGAPFSSPVPAGFKVPPQP